MAPSERVERARREAEGGSAEAQAVLGLWHIQGAEGLEQDGEKAAVWFRKAADLGLVPAEIALAECYYTGQGVEQNFALAAEWGRRAADQGQSAAQFLVGEIYACGAPGIQKDLPLGKRYLELCAAQGDQDAVSLLKELRKCVACGKLDVHLMICSQCRNRRYCDKGCQLWHWNSATDPHKLHCVKRREATGAGGSSSERAGSNQCTMDAAKSAAVAAGAAAAESGVALKEALETLEVAKAATAAAMTMEAVSDTGKAMAAAVVTAAVEKLNAASAAAAADAAAVAAADVAAEAGEDASAEAIYGAEAVAKAAAAARVRLSAANAGAVAARVV
jgi:hypothetical protein